VGIGASNNDPAPGLQTLKSDRAWRWMDVWLTSRVRRIRARRRRLPAPAWSCRGCPCCSASVATKPPATSLLTPPLYFSRVGYAERRIRFTTALRSLRDRLQDRSHPGRNVATATMSSRHRPSRAGAAISVLALSFRYSREFQHSEMSRPL